LADLWRKAEQAQRAVAALQAVLSDDDLRRETILADRDLPLQGGIVAARRIQELVHKNGSDVFDLVDQRAKKRFATIKGDACALEQLIAEFPNAAIVPDALHEIATLEAKGEHPGRGAEAYRTLLRLGQADPVPLLAGLARMYERQHCWEAARATWLLLADQYGMRSLQGRLLRDVAADQLRKSEYQGVPEASNTLPAQVSFSWPGSGRLLVPVRNSLAPRQLEAAFFARAAEVSCRDLATGASRWVSKVLEPPSWLGLHADIVLVAGPEAVEALRLDDGAPLWSFAFPRDGRRRHGRFSEFRLTDTHLFFLQDERRLIALEVASGSVAWSRWAAAAPLRPLKAGRFCAHFFAGEKIVLAQTNHGRRLGLESHTGRLLHEHASAFPWPHDPVPLARKPQGESSSPGGSKGKQQRLCLVEDGKVILLDEATGKELWAHAPPRPTSLSGEPLQVRAGAGALFVLVPRNHGCELERLDPHTGRPAEAHLVSLNPFDLHDAAMDDHSLYIAADNALSCWSLAHGTRTWRQPLTPKSRCWRSVRTAGAIAAYPVEDRHPPWLWLPLGDLLWAVPGTRPGHPLPLSLHDPKNGRVTRRLEVPATSSKLEVQVFPGRLLIGVDAGDF
jgi:hypothetical protein